MLPEKTIDVRFLLTAVQFASVKHSHQRRKGADASPYVNHPIEVAATLAKVGSASDLELLAAAVLHDTVEDTETTFEELEHAFGKTVRDLVREVTDDKILEKNERKRRQIEHAPNLSPRAKLIKLADKTCNVREVLENPPADWSIARRREYLDWAERVVAGLRGIDPELESRFDEVVRRARERLSRPCATNPPDTSA